MAQHKAPTAVTIAPSHEQSAFGAWLERHWLAASSVVVLVAAFILYRTVAKEATQEASEASWARVMAIATEDPATGMITGSPSALVALQSELGAVPAGAWALYIAATSAYKERRYDEALDSLGRLRSTFPTHALLVDTFPAKGEADRVSVVTALEKRIQAQMAWDASHASLYENPPLPADAPRVRLNTDRGAIVVGLYSQLAPSHCENFLKLVREGHYNGTRFHRVMKGFLIQGGDRNTVEGDPSTWGLGGPGYTQERIETGLKHFAGMLSAIPEPNQQEGKISGSQFILTPGPLHVVDDTYMPFGVVLEGLDVVKQIEQAPMASNSFDRPENPVVLQSAEIL